MEKAGHRRLLVGLTVCIGLATLAGPAAARTVPAPAGVAPAIIQRCAFDGDPDASDFVALTVILGLGALRRYLRA